MKQVYEFNVRVEVFTVINMLHGMVPVSINWFKYSNQKHPDKL